MRCASVWLRHSATEIANRAPWTFSMVPAVKTGTIEADGVPDRNVALPRRHEYLVLDHPVVQDEALR